MGGVTMTREITTLALVCTALFGSKPGLSFAQATQRSSDDARRQLERATQETKMRQRQMNESMVQTQAAIEGLRRDMDNQSRNFRASISPLKHADLLRTGAGLMRGAVLSQPPLPKASLDLRPLVTTDAVRAAPPTELGELTMGALADSALPGADTAFQTAHIVSGLRSAYLVGTGRATPALLRPLVPHVTLACERLGAPIDFRGTRNLEWSTPIGHSEPGLSHRITQTGVRTNTWNDPLTNRLITTHRTYSTSKFRMNGGQWNQWYRTQMMSPSTVQPLPRLQTMPRINTYTPPMRTYTQPMQPYTPPVRTYSPPPRTR